MNRLVLIGNGFDIAHGLNTRYEDFINWYWDQWGNRLLKSLERTDTDGLCSFKIKDNIEILNWASVFQGWYYKREDGTDNYLELVQNISRNFTDMKLMRDRVVNKTYCEPLTNRNNI